MHPNITRCLPSLRRFAESIGWDALTPFYHDVDGLDVVWYESGDSGGDSDALFLQINEHPVGNTDTFAASVYAIRHSIWTGWHALPFPETDDALADAIDRTDCWLNRRWFTDKKHRVQYSIEHPECCGFDWERIRNSKPPHEP